MFRGLTAGLTAAGLISGVGAAALAEEGAPAYRATLVPLNSSVTGSDAAGEVTFTISGDDLVIRVGATGLPASMEHLQHFHGFAEGDQAAACPDAAADRNGDGIVDLIETEPYAGTTMVPFHDDPHSMEIVRNTYPSANAAGELAYDKTVSLKGLAEAFAAHFNGQQLDLDRRVVFIHGVPAATNLPSTVASLGDIPAQITIPIACGKIEKVAP